MDVAGTGEEKQKERTPKGYIPVDILLGHEVKNFMTVIWNGWGAIGWNHLHESRWQQRKSDRLVHGPVFYIIGKTMLC